MKDRKVLLSDMDEVVVPLVDKVLDIYYERTGIRLDKNTWTEYSPANVFPREQFEIIEAIFDEPGLCRGLKPLPGAVEGIKLLHESGIDVVFLSAASVTQYSDKHDWIAEHCSFLGDPRKCACFTSRKDRVFGDYIVDDAIHNLVASPANRKIVMDAPWNRDFDGAIRVKSWVEIVAHVLMDNPQDVVDPVLSAAIHDTLRAFELSASTNDGGRSRKRAIRTLITVIDSAMQRVGAA